MCLLSGSGYQWVQALTPALPCFGNQVWEKGCACQFEFVCQEYKNSLPLCGENDRTVQSGCIIVHWSTHQAGRQPASRMGHEEEREVENGEQVGAVGG